MEKQYRDILVEMRRKIVDDVDVNNVINQLTLGSVLQNEDVEKIKAGTTKKEKAEILLDILPTCGPHAFHVFHQALEYQYFWLNDEIESILRNRRFELSDMGRVSPGSPNLPPQPEMTVTRVAKMTKLKSALQKLKPGSYLALHGMKGFGKSCLTANTLKDTTLVKTAFDNKVYWIKFGYERSIEDEILIQLNFLYHQVRNSENINAPLNSEPLKEHLVHYLRNHFSKDNQRYALLILDDVWNKKIIDVFDFHCKTLVITTDIDFLDGKHRDIIEMKDGFTEAESLGLFAKVLETEIDKLPPQAKRIHEECNGMPILIAMFAAQFEEFKHDMRISQLRWQYYLDSLRNKDSTNKVIGKFLTKQEAIFDICIEMLPTDARIKYEALAIFNQDVNIMPQTLEILWDEKRCRVDEHMLDLCHKSLAARHWNVDLKSYVYGVHDLLLCHLRVKMTPEKLQSLHRSFIEKYRKYCNGDFSKLPNDNYSFSYIGHHLDRSKMIEQFPKLYLDFDFIREKIYHTGLRDLLIDLKKYRNLIIGTSEDGEDNVKDLEKFLENQAAVIAEHRRRGCLDLTQIGLNHSTLGFVSRKSVELANAQTTKLYVTHENSSRRHHSTVTSEEVCTVGSTVRFTDDENQILIGNYSGEVILWDSIIRTQTKFHGHDKEKLIRKIIVASNVDFFITLCDDGEVKLFFMRLNENNDLDSYYDLSPLPSPRDKQTYWSGMFNDDSFKDDSRKTFKIDGEIITDMALSPDDSRILVCTDVGTIKVWNIENRCSVVEPLFEEKSIGYKSERVAFTKKGSMLHVLDRDGVWKFYAEQIGVPGRFSYVSTYNLKIKDQTVILFQAPPRNERSMMIVGCFEAIYVKWNETYPQNSVHSFNKQQRAEIQKSDDARFTCATLTYDGQYLVTGDSKGLINVWNLDVGLQPIATFNGFVNSLDTYWLDERTHMICGSGNSVIHKWTLALERLPESARKPFFDAVMKPWGEVDIVAKETSENTIVICHGDKIMAETDRIDGEIVRLSVNSKGDKIVYATDRGSIILFDGQSKQSILIDELEKTPSIVTFVNTDGLTFVAYGTDDDLKVRFNNVATFVEETGHVITIHTIGKNCVITVPRNGIVKFWSVHETNWVYKYKLESCTKEDTLRYSCLSPNARSLTLLTSSGKMIIYTLNQFTADPLTIKWDIPIIHPFEQKLSCCEYSQDDNYLAIGMECGDISIFDIPGLCEVARLKLHCNKVRQLRWSPHSFGSLVLLSINCDELAWWNVAPLLNEKKQNRRSRMGMTRSSSSHSYGQRSSLRLPTSQSMGSEISSTISNKLEALALRPTNGDSSVDPDSHNQTIDIVAETFWQSKIPKQSNKPGLLSVVPLPPSCSSKICVSQDFTKFLSVDVDGSVINFKLHNYK